MITVATPLKFMPQDPAFSRTRWSLVSLARSPDESEAKRALEEICEGYWYPIYAYIRRTGVSPSDAEDITQELFSSIRETIDRADSEKGRLRSFFITIAKRILADDHKRRKAKKRGGDFVIQSLDRASSDGRYSIEPPDRGATPDEFYEYVWAREVVLKCLAVVASEWESRDSLPEFETLKPLILRPMIEWDAAVSRDSARVALGISDSSLRKKIKRVRDRLWKVIGMEVSGTLADPGHPSGHPTREAVVAEVAHIFAALSTNIGSQ